MGRTFVRGVLSAATILLLALPAASARAGWARVDLPGATIGLDSPTAGAAGTFYLDGMVSFDGARTWQVSTLPPGVLDQQPIDASNGWSSTRWTRRTSGRCRRTGRCSRATTPAEATRPRRSGPAAPLPRRR